MKYLALLRGINVGGNNIIKMADLKACFEKIGYNDVSTFIQSGNVIFNSPDPSRKNLSEKIEKILSKKFNYKSRVVVISQKQMKEVVSKAPIGFGKKPDKYRYDVIFIRVPLTAKNAFDNVPVNPEVDQAFKGKDVLYYARLDSKATKSKLNRIVGTPIYQNMTIRNWNTTTKLLTFMGDANKKHSR
jgi:uncharacterized protein (DUF1697 family)